MMEEFVNSAWDLYLHIMEHKDPRIDSWFLMGSLWSPFIVIGLYLILVLGIAPIWMNQKDNKINMCQFLIYYNSTLLVMNAVIGSFLSVLIMKSDYSYLCQSVRLEDADNNEHYIAQWLWAFHITKIIELADTLFIILRRKKGNLTFLHVYHHATIVIATWVGVRFVPGGLTAIIANINSWVHVLMYFYYKLSLYGLNQYYSYKKFVTIAQISQFAATITLCISAIWNQCGYPNWVLAALLLYMLTFMILFIKFYMDNYVTPVNLQRKDDTNCLKNNS